LQIQSTLQHIIQQFECGLTGKCVQAEPTYTFCLYVSALLPYRVIKVDV